MASPSQPTAVIDTTAGKMNCTLFPDKAPIGVANFIGLANRTKEWKNPVSGEALEIASKSNGAPAARELPLLVGGSGGANRCDRRERHDFGCRSNLCGATIPSVCA